MKKKILIIIPSVIIILLLQFVPPKAINKVPISRADGKVDTYFTGTKLGTRLLGVSLHNNPFDIKVLGILDMDGAKLGILKRDGVDRAVYIDKRSISIYKDGELEREYKVEYNLDPPDQEIIDSCIGDFNNDGIDEIALLLKDKGDEYGNNLVVLGYDGGFKQLLVKSFKDINPWKIQVCDIDGDGEKEVSIGVYTRAPSEPAYTQKLFIYNFKEGTFYSKWLGLKLSKPFEDYMFSDIDGDGTDELLSIEYLMDSSKIIDIYRWNGSEFISISQSPAFDDIAYLESDGDTIRAKVKIDKRWKNKTYKYNGLILEEQED